MKSSLACAALLILHAPVLAQTCPSPDPHPTNVTAHYEQGHTFVTWDEIPGFDGWYHVYRSEEEPITTSNLGTQALPTTTLVGGAGTMLEVPQRSSEFFADREASCIRCGTCQPSDFTPRHSERLWVRVAGQPIRMLDGDEGVLVVTPKTIGASGTTHYAVLAADETSGEHVVVCPENTDSTTELLADPVPLLLPTSACSANPDAYVYLQYMDPERFNETLAAPNLRNCHYGEDASATEIRRSIQYGFTYEVVYPAGASSEAPLPITLSLGGRQGVGAPSATCPSTVDSIEIRPYDQGNTWYYGCSESFDYRELATNPYPLAADGWIVNYTEQRILRMLHDLAEDSHRGPIDPQRIYVQGFSMGASGTLALATRYPNVFAAAHASKGMTNYKRYMLLDNPCQPTNPYAPACYPCCPTASFAIELRQLWGDPADKLLARFEVPDHIDGPGFDEWGMDIEPYSEQFSVWEWQNHKKNLRGNPNVEFAERLFDEMAPFGMVHGLQDTSIPYCTQTFPVYPAINDGLRSMGLKYNNSGHIATGLGVGMPPALAKESGLAFHAYQVLRSESVPGLSFDVFANMADPCFPAQPIGAEFFTDIEWGATWNYSPWGQAPVDSPTAWGMSFQTTAAQDVVVDVTPRRLQQFVADPVAHTSATHTWTDGTQNFSATLTVTPQQNAAQTRTLLVIEDVVLKPGFVHRLSIP